MTATEIILDKPRTFKLTWGTLMRFEKATGKSALTMDFQKGMNASDILALLWAGLVHEDESLTMDFLADYLHPGNIGLILEKVFGSMSDAMGNPQDRPIG